MNTLNTTTMTESKSVISNFREVIAGKLRQLFYVQFSLGTYSTPTKNPPARARFPDATIKESCCEQLRTLPRYASALQHSKLHRRREQNT